jgi:hypothetical protein
LAEKKKFLFFFHCKTHHITIIANDNFPQKCSNINLNLYDFYFAHSKHCLQKNKCGNVNEGEKIETVQIASEHKNAVVKNLHLARQFPFFLFYFYCTHVETCSELERD